MANFKIILDPRLWFFVSTNWNFTGRIKYEKFSKHCTVFFEIEYFNRIGLTWAQIFKNLYHNGTLSLEGKQRITDWVKESEFMLLEIPETTIQECEK